MKVEPGLLVHPKYVGLRRKLGPRAAEVLLQLWLHCEADRRGGFWQGKGPEYVETVCNWGGTAGKLYEILKTQKVIDEVDSGIVIHGFNERNSRLLSNWELGDRRAAKMAEKRDGEGSQADRSAEPRLSQGCNSGGEPEKALGEPWPNQHEAVLNEGNVGGVGVQAPRGTGSEVVEWPSREEWWAAARMEGLPEQVIRDEWNYQESLVPARRWRGIDRTRLRHHAARVLVRARSWGRLDREMKTAPGEEREAELARLGALAEGLTGEELEKNRAARQALLATGGDAHRQLT